jgi:Fe2+ or Zn2+ uptake regulation protein
VLSCDTCGRIAGVDGTKALAAIDKAAASAGFMPKSAVVEVWGVCANCAEAAA